MMALPRTDRAAFRRAFAASVVLHLALAGAIVFVVRLRPEPAPVPPRIDTGADLVVRVFDAGPDIDARATDPLPAAPAPPVEPPSVEERPAPRSESGRTPHATIAPRALSPEMLAVISRSVAARATSAAPLAPAVAALHGAMRSGQSIVYVLDTSGSMGEHGKLARARAALIATLRAQPPGVKFQVIVYNSAARSLFPAASCVFATAANIEAAATSLAALEANGRSNHAEALRAAANHRHDAIFILTDSSGLRREELRSILAQFEKRASISLSRVTASSIEPPAELR